MEKNLLPCLGNELQERRGVIKHPLAKQKKPWLCAGKQRGHPPLRQLPWSWCCVAVPCGTIPITGRDQAHLCLPPPAFRHGKVAAFSLYHLRWQGTKILPAGSFLLPSFLLSGRCSPPDRVLLWWPWGGFQNKISFFCPWQIAVFIYSEVLHSALVHMGFEIRKWSSSSQLKLLRSGKGAAQGAWIPPKKDNKPLKSFSFAQPSDSCAIHGPWG